MGSGLSLNISETDNSLNYDLAIEVAEYFRLKKDEAKSIVTDIKSTVSDWKVVADKYGISKTEQSRMEKAFRIK